MSVKNLVSLEDEGVVAESFSYLRAKAGEVIRINLPFINQIVQFSQHYSEHGGFARCLADKDEDCPMCAHADAIKKFKLSVLRYNVTDYDENTDLDSLTVVPTTIKFGTRLFSALRSLHKNTEGGISGRDIKMTCTDEKYQFFDFEVQEDTIIRESESLMATAENAINAFPDFNESNDRDLQFPTRQKAIEWVSRTTKQVAPVSRYQEQQQPQQEQELTPDALDEFAQSMEAPRGNVADLI